jgi:signal peptidase II
MTALLLAMLVVFVGDRAAKSLLAYTLEGNAASLGPFGTLRVVTGRLWLRRRCGNLSASAVWGVWLMAAVTLAIASSWVPSSGIFVGMVLGGSLGNVVEFVERGSVSDYVCLRLWPAFNLADVALVGGAVGTLATLVMTVLEKAS